MPIDASAPSSQWQVRFTLTLTLGGVKVLLTADENSTTGFAFTALLDETDLGEGVDLQAFVQEMLKDLHIAVDSLSDYIPLDTVINQLYVSYTPQTSVFELAATVDGGSFSFFFATLPSQTQNAPGGSAGDTQQAYFFGLSLNDTLSLQSMVDTNNTVLSGLMDKMALTGVQVFYASHPINTIQIPAIPADSPSNGPVASPFNAPIRQGLTLILSLVSGTTAQQVYLPIPTSTADLLKATADDNLGFQKWFTVQKAFGPIYLHRIGVSWNDGNLSLLLDAELSLSILTLSLVGFSISFPPAAIFSPSTLVREIEVSLDGLQIAYQSGPVAVSGGFLRATWNSGIVYAGDLVIRVPEISIGAIGAYTNLFGHPSLFIFIFVNAEIGGPPYFFVTGLSGGFGYNYQLNPPSPTEIQNFPLIQFVLNPTQSGMSGQQTPQDQYATALKNLTAQDPITKQDYLAPSLGDYWVAAGIQFTSFELVNSFALLIISFGNNVELSLLGLSTIQLPPDADRAFAYAALALAVVLNPAEGVFRATAVLTPNSFVFDPACKLTGEFAFFVWFSQYPGDFVLTLGGYHPNYVPQPHYPSVARLGFNWVMSDVTIIGQAYLALTPSAVMAGGLLSLLYQSGSLSAWFKAQADFIISWNPFYYNIYVSISIGVSYIIKSIVHKKVTAELGVTLNLIGPPFSGTATIHWWVISFTVHIGAKDTSKPSPLTAFDDFSSAFLPKPSNSQGGNTGLGFRSVRAGDSSVADAQPQAILQGSVSNGQLSNPDHNPWLVNGDALVLLVQSAIPSTTIQFASKIPVNGLSSPAFGIRPMAQSKIGATLTITLAPGLNTTNPIDFTNWTFTQVTNGGPSALWGTQSLDPNSGPPDSKTELIPDMLFGVRMQPPANPNAYQGPPIIQMSDLAYEPIGTVSIPLNGIIQGDPPPAPSQGSLADLTTAIMAPATRANRNAMITTINGRGYDFTGDIDLSAIASGAANIYVGTPTFGALGTTPFATSDSTLPGMVEQLDALPSSASPVPTGITAAAIPQIGALVHRYLHSAANVSLDRSLPGRLARANTVSTTLHFGKSLAGANDHSALRQTFHLSIRETSAVYDTKLRCGSTVVWDIPPFNVNPIVIRVDGELPVQLFVFDRHQLLTNQSWLSREGTRELTLPREAVQLVMRARSASVVQHALNLPVVTGWQGDSPLHRINPIAYLGEDGIVRPERPLFMRQGRFVRRGNPYAEISGAALVRDNWIHDRSKQAISGWVETLLPSSMQTFAILLRRDSKAAPPEQGTEDTIVSQIDRTAGGITNRRLERVHTVQDATFARLVYTSMTITIDPYTAIRVQAPRGWLLDGCLGFSAASQEVKTAWDTYRIDFSTAAFSASDPDTRSHVECITSYMR